MSRILTITLVALLIAPPALRAQTQQGSQSTPFAPIFAAYQHQDTPGCTLGIDFSGHPTLTAAYGMADLEHAVANTPETVFEAGSVSKQFTAAAVMLLIERGQVSLDDDIHKYFPQLPTYQRPITVRELLNHTSGLRDWGEVESIAGWPRTTRVYTHPYVLDILSRQSSLNYAPGDAWSYTNSGYNLAAMLVEKVTGVSLQAFMKKEFFEPLGMASTQWRDDFHRVVLNRAIAYDPKGSEWVQDMPFENIYGNGGLLTTVGDLLKWNQNLATGKLHAELFAKMQQPSALADGKKIGYGLGLFLETLDGLPEVDHSGATAGYRAWLGRIPSKGLSVAILCNAANANTTEMAINMMRQELNLPAPPPAAPLDPIQPGLYRNSRDFGTLQVGRRDGDLTFDGRPTHLAVRFNGGKMLVPSPVYGEEAWERVEPSTPSNLAEFTGPYLSEEAETYLRVDVEKGSLMVHRRPDASFPLTPTYRDAFSSPLGSVRFLRDANGKITSLDLGTSRVWDLRFTRAETAAAAGHP